MNPRLRLWLIGGLAAFLGMATAFGIADQAYGLAVILAGSILWLIAESRRVVARPRGRGLHCR